MYQNYAIGCSLISKSRSLIYDLPQDKQKEAQDKLIDTIKEYRSSYAKNDAAIARSFGKKLEYSEKGTTMPDSEISYKSNGKTVKKELDFYQYLKYAKDYMNKASAAQKETIKTDEYKKADYTSKQDMLSKARSKAKKEAVSNFLSKNNK